MNSWFRVGRVLLCQDCDSGTFYSNFLLFSLLSWCLVCIYKLEEHRHRFDSLV